MPKEKEGWYEGIVFGYSPAQVFPPSSSGPLAAFSWKISTRTIRRMPPLRWGILSKIKRESMSPAIRKFSTRMQQRDMKSRQASCPVIGRSVHKCSLSFNSGLPFYELLRSKEEMPIKSCTLSLYNNRYILVQIRRRKLQWGRETSFSLSLHIHDNSVKSPQENIPIALNTFSV